MIRRIGTYGTRFLTEGGLTIMEVPTHLGDEMMSLLEYTERVIGPSETWTVDDVQQLRDKLRLLSKINPSRYGDYLDDCLF